MRQSALALFVILVALCSCQSDTTTDQPAATHTVVQPARAVPVASKATNSPGVLLTSWVSSDILASLSQNDRLKSQQAELRAFTAPIGQLVTWNNMDDKRSGTLSPLHDSYSAQGLYCRDFQQTITIDGMQKQGYAKACQLSDGSWKIVK